MLPKLIFSFPIPRLWISSMVSIMTSHLPIEWSHILTIHDDIRGPHLLRNDPGKD
jgi:hypothetical protein